MPGFETLGIDTANSAINDVMGIGLNMLTHPIQVRQQQDFIDQQMKAQQQMQKYSQGLALDTWNKTNYEAQVKHMENAGLSVGLMYGGSGAGGATTNSGASGNISGGQAHPAAQEIGLNMQQQAQSRLLDSQAKNLDADTALKQQDAAKRAKEIPSIEASTDKTRTETRGLEIDNIIKGFEAKLKEANQSNVIGMLNEEFNKLKADRELSEANKNRALAEIKQMSVENALMRSNMRLNESELKVNAARITEIITGIEQRWQALTNSGLSIGQHEIDGVRRRLMDQFNMDMHTADQIIGITKVVGGAAVIKSMPNQPQEKYINVSHDK